LTIFQSDRREPEAPGGPQEVPGSLQKALRGPTNPPGGPKSSQRLPEAPRSSQKIPRSSQKLLSIKKHEKYKLFTEKTIKYCFSYVRIAKRHENQ